MTTINAKVITEYFENEVTCIGLTVKSNIEGREFFITQRNIYFVDSNSGQYAISCAWDTANLKERMAFIEAHISNRPAIYKIPQSF